jgi:hypothetical protein
MKNKEDWFYLRKESNCKSINATALNSGELFIVDFINKFTDDCYASLSKKELENLHIKGLSIRKYKLAKTLFIEEIRSELEDTFKPNREDLNFVITYLEEIVDRRKRQEEDFKSWIEHALQAIIVCAISMGYFHVKGDITKLNLNEYLTGFTVVIGIAFGIAPLISKFIAYKNNTYYAKKLFRENVNLKIAKSLELPLNLLENYR